MNLVYLHQIINHNMYSEFKLIASHYLHDTFKLDVYVSQLYFSTSVTNKVAR